MVLPYEKPSATLISFAPMEQLATQNQFGQNNIVVQNDDTVIDAEPGLESSIFGN